MRIALIADTFPPHRSSGAVQLRDLAREYALRGHNLTVIVPDPDIATAWTLEMIDGYTVLRLRAPRTKTHNKIFRALAECVMPFAMMRQFRRSPLASEKWDGVIWYSPSIFHGPLVKYLSRRSNCRTYLIVRDIFPEWAADMGVIGRGLSYKFFKAVARYQYSVADTIGVQTKGNLLYFSDWQNRYRDREIEVLPNWLGRAGRLPCEIRIQKTCLSDKAIFVYAGNMGVAQNLHVLIDVAERLQARSDIGFLFVGRGSEVSLLKRECSRRRLQNTLFFDEIDPDEIPDLYAQCHFGIVSLDMRHRSHNIPGKFLTYMQSGLPVLAIVNSGNDLVDVIRSADVGKVSNGFASIDEITAMAEDLVDHYRDDPAVNDRCRNLFARKFAVSFTTRQILRHLTDDV